MPFRCHGPSPRREFLKVGAYALGGLTLGDVMSARAANGHGKVDTSVIMLYLHGGPSQLETYDLKPNALRPTAAFSNRFRPTCREWIFANCFLIRLESPISFHSSVRCTTTSASIVMEGSSS